MYLKLLTAASAISLLVLISGCGTETTQPAGPASTGSETSAPEVTGPETTEPEVTEPAATEPETTEPSDEDLDVKPEEVEPAPPPVLNP